MKTQSKKYLRASPHNNCVCILYVLWIVVKAKHLLTIFVYDKQEKYNR